MKKRYRIGITTIYCIMLVAILCVNFFYRRDKQYWMYYDLLLSNQWLLPIAVVVSLILYFFAKKATGFPAVERRKWLLGLVSVLLLIVQCYLVKSIYLSVDWDVFYVKEAAEQYLLGEVSHWYEVYFANNPNNVMMYGITILSLKIGELLRINGYTLLVVIGILLNHLAVLLSSFCVYHLTKREGMLYLAYGLGVLLFGLSPWMVAPYTDIFSVVFPIATLYLYLRMKEWEGNIVGKVLVVTILPAVFVLLKPTNVFVLLAIGVVELLSEKRNLIGLLIGLMCFCFLMTASKSLLYHLMDYQEDESVVKPMEHYFMLGSNYNMVGMYNQPDDEYTCSFEGKQAKRKADRELAVSRYREMGWEGWMRHIGNKIYLNYSNGIFGWGKEQNFVHSIPQKESFMETLLCNFYYVGGEHLLIEENAFGTGGDWFVYYATWRQLIWLLVQIACLETGILYLYKRKEKEGSNPGFEVVMITLLGVFVFLSVFETNARYLYSFLPLYVVGAVLGVFFVTMGQCEEHEERTEYNC